MVELWGNTLSFIGSLFGILIDTILFDAFFPRKRPERYYWPLIVTGTFIIFIFSIFVGNRFGYTFAILFEIVVYYLLCAFLYQSRWDRRLFVVVTNYAILYSASYWGDALCIFFLDLTYEEYVWNIPLYSAAFILRLLAIFFHCTADTKVSSAIICWQTGSRLGAIVCRFPNKHATYHLADLHISP